MWFIYNIWEDLNSAILSYDIKFEEGFDFVKWWKLPWLCWWSCPRWLEWSDKWFSTRFMWREDWTIEIYAYLQNEENSIWEWYWKWNFYFKSNKLYNISQEISLNDIWKNNWIMKIYIDWKLIYENKKIMYRKEDNIKIDQLLFSTFFGWWNESWATPKDINIELSNFTLK